MTSRYAQKALQGLKKLDKIRGVDDLPPSIAYAVHNNQDKGFSDYLSSQIYSKTQQQPTTVTTIRQPIFLGGEIAQNANKAYVKNVATQQQVTQFEKERAQILLNKKEQTKLDDADLAAQAKMALAQFGTPDVTSDFEESVKRMSETEKAQLVAFVQYVNTSMLSKNASNTKSVMSSLLHSAPDTEKNYDAEVEIIRTLDRYDTEQHFLLKSYMNKKPTSAIELADVLLQAAQMHTSFNFLDEAQVQEHFDIINNATLDAATREREMTTVMRKMKWRARQAMSQVLGLPTKPIPQDLIFDAVRFAPLSQRIQNAYTTFVEQGKQVASNDAVAIEQLLQDWKARVVQVKKSSNLLHALFREEWKSKDFAVAFVTALDQQQEQLVQLVERAVQFKNEAALAQITDEAEKKQVAAMNNSKIASSKLSASPLTFDKQEALVKQALKEQQTAQETMIARVEKSFSALSDVTALARTITNAYYTHYVPESIKVSQANKPTDAKQSMTQKRAQQLFEQYGAPAVELTDSDFADAQAKNQELNNVVELTKKKLALAKAFQKDHVEPAFAKIPDFIAKIQQAQEQAKGNSKKRLLYDLRMLLTKYNQGDMIIRAQQAVQETTQAQAEQQLTPERIEKLKSESKLNVAIHQLKEEASGYVAKHGLAGYLHPNLYERITQITKEHNLDPAFEKRKNYAHRPEFDDPNHKNFIPKYQMQVCDVYSSSHAGYQDPMTRKVVLTCKLEDLKLSAEAQKRFEALVGPKLNKSNQTFTIRCSVFHDREQNVAYLRQLLLELRREAIKADQSDEYKIRDDRAPNLTPVEKLEQRLQFVQEEEQLAERAMANWKKYRQAGKLIVGADLTYGEGESAVAEDKKVKKRSKARELGYGAGDDDDEDFETILAPSKDRNMLEEFVEDE